MFLKLNRYSVSGISNCDYLNRSQIGCAQPWNIYNKPMLRHHRLTILPSINNAGPSLSVFTYCFSCFVRDILQLHNLKSNETVLKSPASPPPDIVQNVSHLPEDHLQAAAGGCLSESAGRVGDGVSTVPGLHGKYMFSCRSHRIGELGNYSSSWGFHCILWHKRTFIF